MSNSIDTRSPFFPKGRNPVDKTQTGQVGGPERNSPDRAGELMNKTSQDAKVSIPEGVRDFSRIKKVAGAAPEVDNSEKIARLKAQIQAGTYEMDYDGIADKMLQSEF